MIQGGDPTGTGKGGQSIYGNLFQDELKDHLQHNKRGIGALNSLAAPPSIFLSPPPLFCFLFFSSRAQLPWPTVE